MADFAIIPRWFFGINIGLELLFAVISLLVSTYSFKDYKLSGQRQPKLFGISFLFISVAYFIQSLLNFALISKLTESVCMMAKMSAIHNLNITGIYAHILFFTAGLITLTYMTLKLKDNRIYILFFMLVFLALFASANKLYLFYLLSSILLIHICYYYFRSYLNTRQVRILIVFIAFVFLLFGRIHFIFALNHGTYYVIGHFLELIAYGLILANLLIVIKGKRT